MRLGRASRLPPLQVHVKPVGVPQPDYGARHVAALVLIVEPGSQRRIDPAVVATTLGLTPPESQVAVLLAEGKSVGDIAQATGLSKHTLYWHLQRIYQKLSISRQVDLVRLGPVDRRVRVTAALPASSMGGPVAGRCFYLPNRPKPLILMATGRRIWSINCFAHTGMTAKSLPECTPPEVDPSHSPAFLRSAASVQLRLVPEGRADPNPGGRDRRLRGEAEYAMCHKHHRRYQGRFTRLASIARSLTVPAAAGLLLASAFTADTQGDRANHDRARHHQ